MRAGGGGGHPPSQPATHPATGPRSAEQQRQQQPEEGTNEVRFALVSNSFAHLPRASSRAFPV
jgi:hypothetical protein